MLHHVGKVTYLLHLSDCVLLNWEKLINQLFEGQIIRLTVSNIPRLASKSLEKVAELYISSLLPHQSSYNISVFYGEPLEEA